MKRSTGLTILVLLGVLDLFWLVSLALPIDTPVPVGILGAIFGIVTLAAARPAFQGSRPATMTVVISRIASALVLCLPAYFFSDTPAWTLVTVSIAIVATIVGIALVLGTSRARTAQPA
jgi:hypothetical protein